MSTDLMPKKIHYVWMGKDISSTALRSILTNKSHNPDYETIIWTDNKSSIINTLNKFTDASKQKNLTIKSLDDLFSELKKSPLAQKKLSDYYTDLSTNEGEKFTSSIAIPVALESILTREKSGIYPNYAAASDVARLAILYLYGGMYFDVDVVMDKPIDKFDSLMKWKKSLQKYGLGMLTTSTFAVNNNVLSGLPNAEIISSLLVDIVRHYNTSYPELTSKATKRIIIQADLNNNQNTTEKLNFLRENVSWAAKRANYNRYPSYDNRFHGTLKITGPGAYPPNLDYLGFSASLGHFAKAPKNNFLVNTIVKNIKYDSNRILIKKPADKLYSDYVNKTNADADWANNKPSLQNGARAEEAPIIAEKRNFAEPNDLKSINSSDLLVQNVANAVNNQENSPVDIISIDELEALSQQITDDDQVVPSSTKPEKNNQHIDDKSVKGATAEIFGNSLVFKLKKQLNQLNDSLNQIQNLNDTDSAKFNEGIQTLLNYENSIKYPTAETAKYTLGDIISILETASTDSSSYTLMTEDQKITVGVFAEETNNKQYYVYDPKMQQLASFTRLTHLKSYLTKYLNIQDHRASAHNSTTEFGFILDSDRKDPLPIKIENGVFFDFNNLINGEQPIIDVLNSLRDDNQKRINLLNDFANYEDSSIKEAQNFLLNKQFAETFLAASQRLYETYQLNSDWVPILTAIKKNANGEYSIPFVNKYNKNQKDALKWINTKEEAFIKTKQFIDFEPVTHLSNTHGIDGINLGFTAQLFISWLDEYHKNSSTTPDSLPSNLATAIKIHHYINLTQTTQAITQDVSELIDIVQHLATNAPLNNTIFNSINSGLVTVLNGVSFGMDTYEFIHAKTEVDKHVTGTQLAFDSVSLAMNFTSLGASIAGYSTLSAISGALAVPVSGLGVGIIGLAKVYGDFAQDTQMVVQYFNQVDKAYKIGYDYNADKDRLTPLTGSVIKKLDLENGTIEFGSQYLYSSDYNLFAFMDPSQDNGDRKQAIELRKVLENKEYITISSESKKAKTIVLPNTPKSFINYYNQKIISSTASKSEGIEKLHLIEKNSNGHFKFEHFSFPYKSVIRSISQEYVHTDIDILLDNQNRILLVPELPKITSGGHVDLYRMHSLSNNMHYNIVGKGSSYVISLNEGATISLSSSENTSSNWALDTRRLDSDQVEVLDNQVRIGDIIVNINGIENQLISIIKHDNSVFHVDFSSKSLEFIENHLYKRCPDEEKNVDTDLKAQAQELYLSGKYIPINNHFVEGKIVGRAYYDVQNKRTLFTQPNQFLIEKLSLKEQIDAIHLISFNEGKPKFTQPDKLLQYVKLANKIEETIYDTIVYSYNALNKRFDSIKYQLDSLKELKKNIHRISNKQIIIHPLALLNIWAGLFLLNEAENQINETITKLTNNFNKLNEKLRADLNFESTFNLYKKGLDYLEQRIRILVDNHPAKQAQLAAVIDTDAYFYNANSAAIWRTDAQTGEVKTVYKSHWDNLSKSGMRVWLEGNQLYATCNYIFGNKTGELVYILNEHEMQLISIQANVEELPLLQHISSKSDYIQILFPNIPNKKSAITYYNSILPVQLSITAKTIHARYAPFVGIHGKTNGGEFYKYWIQNTNDEKKVIAFNSILSEHTTISLTLVSAMKKEEIDVFLFFDPIKKTLFRQEGAGTYIIQSKKVDTLIKNEALIIATDIINVQTVNNNLFAIADSGLISRVSADGQLLLSAVNERWITQQTNWYQQLSTLKSERVLTVLGIKAKNCIDNLPAWYVNNKLIIASLKLVDESSIEFLGLNDFGNFAYLLNTKTNELYKQTIVSQPELAKAFGSDHILDNFNTLPKAIQLFPKESFKSITYVNNALRLVTTEGAILSMDNADKLHLIGVDKSWLIQNYNLSDSLNALAKKYLHEEVILLQNDEKNSPSWYSFNLNKTVTAKGLFKKDTPRYLGQCIADGKPFIYFNSNKGIYACNPTDGSISHKSEITGTITRLGTTLLIAGTATDDTLRTFSLTGVKSNVMSGGEGVDTYEVDQAKNQLKVIINNFSKDKKIDSLKLSVNNLYSTFFSRMQTSDINSSITKNDLVISNKENPLVVVKNIFGNDKQDYNHLNLIINDPYEHKVVSLATLAEAPIGQYTFNADPIYSVPLLSSHVY